MTDPITLMHFEFHDGTFLQRNIATDDVKDILLHINRASSDFVTLFFPSKPNEPLLFSRSSLKLVDVCPIIPEA